MDALFTHNGITLEHGAHHNKMFRLPYTWRMLAAISNDQPGMVSAVLGAELLHNLLQSTNLPPECMEDLRDYCDTVLEDSTQDLMSSPGWITLRSAKCKLGEDCHARLAEGGFVRVRSMGKKSAWVSPQIPPLVAAVAFSIVQERLEENVAQKSQEEATEIFLADCQRLPYCELVGAAALRAVTYPETFGLAINSLLQIPPTINEIPEDPRFSILVEGHEPIDIDPELIQTSKEEYSNHTYGDILPYLILSHVLRGANLKDERLHDSLLGIFGQVANARVPLISSGYRNREQFQDAAPVSMYSLKGGGSLVDPCNGVIEPITDALRSFAMDAPQAFQSFVNAIIGDSMNHFPALNRAWLAVHSIAHLNTPISDDALQWSETLQIAIQSRIADELGADKG